ncbi:hypothetical protein FQN54_000207 [Arachnomyces sp. PD_36]|nr:hypothetical protein FQN54_000207 [Arachnomyces sp. PD_36]
MSSHYLSEPVPKFYYDQIKNGDDSLKNAVDNFWNNTLPHYFTQDKLFRIGLEQRPLEGAAVVKPRPDLTIRYIRNRASKKIVFVVLMANKRMGCENPPRPAEWEDYVEELADYLRLVRSEEEEEEEEEGDTDSILFGVVSIESYVRFYYLSCDRGFLDYPTTRTGGSYELKEDEGEIHGILTEYAINACQ